MGLGRLSTARRSNKDHFRRAARCIVTMANPKHTDEVHPHFAFRSALTIVSEHKPAKDVLNSSHVDGVFVKYTLSSFCG